MRSVERRKALLRQCRLILLGMFAALYVTAPAYAFTPSQVPLLSAAAVTPNVMLQVDNSGSMDTIITDSNYKDESDYGNVYSVNRSCLLFLCSYSQGSRISNGTADYIFVGNLSQSYCSNGQYAFYRNSSTPTCLTLPDPAQGGETRYPINYLAYLVTQANAGNTISVSTSSRMTTAISVALNLVANNRALRIGLAQFNPPTNNDRGPGGKIAQSIVDLSPVTASGSRSAVSQATADSNYASLRSAISALTANSNTPLAETYYQVTRYFRGLAPSPSYTGSPSTFTSPIQYRCQKNYGVVITDGLPTYDRTFPTNDPNDPNKYLPNWDRVNNDGANPTGGDSEGDSLYLDDIAKFAYDIDMRTTSSTPSTDLAGSSWDTTAFLKQNLRTYTVGFTASNDMLSAAATYGLGTYYQASDQSTLSTALSAALSDINSKAGSGGAAATSSSTLQAGTRFYQTLYDPTDWHGTIKAFTLSSTGTVDTTSTPFWNTDTTIVPNGTGTARPTETTFSTWKTDTNAAVALDFTKLSTAQQAAITATLPTGVSGAQLVNWAAGVTNASLRTRTRLLGDIVNSPLVVARPTDQTASDLVGDTTYTTYLSTKSASMDANILVNGNDGFLSVINPTNGKRRYAYMPSTALTSLATLASSSYGTGSHKFTADGPIGVYDTQLTAKGNWQTVAFAGAGAGAKAYYALQLFNNGVNSITPLWEVRAPDSGTNDFSDLGYAYSKPVVARMADGTGVVIIGNGYGSSTGVAALYVLNVATGALIKKIVLSGTAGTDNGLSSVAIRVNASNVVQSAYAGDLKGRMWKFDLSDSSPSNWKVAYSGSPFFTASTDGTRPITVQPLILDHPNGGKLVYFGTGKFSETSDKTTTAQEDFYAIWDADTGTGNIAESQLQAQTITGSYVANGNEYITSSQNSVDWTSKKGWYMPLATSGTFLGERVIYPAQTSRGRILFTTAAVNSSDPCESTGTGRLLELDAETGKRLNYAILDTTGDGLVDSNDASSSGVVFGGGVPYLAAIVQNVATSTDAKIGIDSSGALTQLREKGGESGTSMRIMWRQIQ